MRKRTYIILALLLILGAAFLVVLRSYSLEIVHSVVLNAVIQRAPDSYPEYRIREAFQSSYQTAVESGRKEYYLEKLNALSHRLEKVQSLETDEVDRILEELSKPTAP